MTAAIAGAVRGRPSAARLADSLAASRRINTDLRMELRVERHEGAQFATEVRAHAARIYLAAQSDRLDLALHEASVIGALADRHLRQRGSAA
jgi:hypothetical protein